MKTVTFKESKKEFKNYFDGLEKKAKEEQIKQFKDACNKVYLQIKAKYENVTITNEDPSKNKTIKLPTTLNFNETENGVEMTISAGTNINNMIMFAKTHGTGFNVNPEILKALGVSAEEAFGQKDISAWSFQPTNEHVAIYKALETQIKFEAKKA